MRKLILVYVFALLASPCAARIITVDDNGPADFNNIQAAIDDSNDGDTVLVLPGTYTGPTAYDIDFGGRAITVRSTDPNDPCVVAATIIDYGNFRFNGGEGPNSIVDGLTITRTTGQRQGIECWYSSPTIRKCIIEGCPYGGMYLRDSNAVISDCIIRSNGNYFPGGPWGEGILCGYGGSVTITDSIISNNICFGGIYCFDYGDSSFVLDLTGCTITGNSTEDDGGGICLGKSIGGSITLTITDCNISGNSADGTGGGIYCDAAGPSSLTITNSTISSNSAGGDGGGLYSGEQVTTTITNCSVGDNAAEDSGGGIDCHTTYTPGGPFSPTITNSTISGNSAKNYDGGGVYCALHTIATINNCNISRNYAGRDGGAVYAWAHAHCIAADSFITGNWAGHGAGGLIGFDQVTRCTITGNFATDYAGGLSYCRNIINCIVWANADLQIYTNISTVYSDVQGGWPGLGNIDEDPCFVDAGKWVDANDPNTVVEPNEPNAVWIDGDYHLKSEAWRWDAEANEWTWDEVTSRCIDAGNPGSPLGDEALTLDVDPLNRMGENLRINMGAYGGTAEASMPPYYWALLADLNNDGTVNFIDLGHYVGYWLDAGSELPADLNRDATVDLTDYALLGQDFLLQTSWHQ